MKTKTYAEYKKEQRGKQQSNSNCGSSTPMNNSTKQPVPLTKYVSSSKKQQLIPPGSLGTLTKATYDRLKQQSQQPQHSRRMGPTTSALVRPAPLFSRPPPGAALRVMPPKKRVKLDEDDEVTTNMKKSNEQLNKQPNSIKPKPVYMQNPYLKGKEKLEERNRNLYLKGKDKLEERDRNPYLKGKDKLEERNRHQPPKKQMRVPSSQSSIMRLPESTKATTAIDKTKNKKAIAKAPKPVSRPSITQKSFLSQRSQLLQRSQLQQRSPLPHRSPTISPRSPIPPKSSLTQRSSNRNVFPGKRQLAQKQPVSTAVEEEVCSNNTTEQTKQSTFLGVKFKRMKKANLADQIKRSKEGKLDLMTPDSILTSVHIKDLLNESTFALLPPAYQYQLLILLPECDRTVGSDSALRLSQHALNNEFFTRSCQEFKDKLMDGEFNSDIIQRAKHEVEINNRIDPWKVRYFEPVYGCSSSSAQTDQTDKLPPKLEVVESSWASFLKFAENSTDDFEEALAKMQIAVKAAHQKQMEKEKEELQKREESIQQQRSEQQTLKTLPPNRCATFRNTTTLKSKNVMRVETAAKEKSRKALKKAQILQRKKAFDKQLKDAKAKILEEARSSSRKEDDSIKSKLLNNSLDCSQLAISSMEGTMNHFNHISSMNSNIFNSMECKVENENNKVINLCDSNALKNLIKNSDTTKPVNNFVPQIKHGPSVRKRPGSRIVKGPSTFLTNSDGLCPCDLKSMVMCIQCETFWHGDSINGEQLCMLCT